MRCCADSRQIRFPQTHSCPRDGRGGHGDTFGPTASWRGSPHHTPCTELPKLDAECADARPPTRAQVASRSQHNATCRARDRGERCGETPAQHRGGQLRRQGVAAPRAPAARMRAPQRARWLSKAPEQMRNASRGVIVQTTKWSRHGCRPPAWRARLQQSKAGRQLSLHPHNGCKNCVTTCTYNGQTVPSNNTSPARL